MFSHIMVPVDLRHTDRLERALAVTAEEAKHHDAKVTFVSASNATPGEIAHSPDEFREKLASFAKDKGQAGGYPADAHALILHDTTADLDHALVEASKEINADLVIMASHRPNFADYFWSSNGGAVASHANASVMIVREAE